MTVGARNFFIYTGYVESGSISCMAFVHTNGFDTVENALRHLGKCFLAGYQLEKENRYWIKCCRAARETDVNCCPDCGQRVKEPDLDTETLSYFIMDYQRGDHDSAPYETWEILATNGWWPLGDSRLDKKSNIINITILPEKGDEVLAHLALTDDSLKDILEKTYGSITVADRLQTYNT